jgi:hypothetical protein
MGGFASGIGKPVSPGGRTFSFIAELLHFFKDWGDKKRCKLFIYNKLFD